MKQLMMIRNVSVSDLCHIKGASAVRGSVVLELAAKQAPSPDQNIRMQFLCHTVLSGNDPRHSDRILLALAHDALRQARRLPDCADLAETDAFQAHNIRVLLEPPS